MGTAKRIHARQEEQVFVDTEYDGRIERDTYDYLIVAIGFDPLWFTSLLDKEAHSALAEATNGLERRAIERSIGEDLSVQNITPRLHLPMAAGVAQGPGFPNLSCLGLPCRPGPLFLCQYIDLCVNRSGLCGYFPAAQGVML